MDYRNMTADKLAATLTGAAAEMSDRLARQRQTIMDNHARLAHSNGTIRALDIALAEERAKSTELDKQRIEAVSHATALAERVDKLTQLLAESDKREERMRNWMNSVVKSGVIEIRVTK